MRSARGNGRARCGTFTSGWRKSAPKFRAATPLEQSVTYHESCHLCHGQRVSAQPRELLRAIPGLRLIELAEASWCCGSAGIYNITQPAMSEELLERKLAHLEKTGAAVVATANPGCLLQLEAGLRRKGRAVRVAHPVTLLAEAYRREPAAAQGEP